MGRKGQTICVDFDGVIHQYIHGEWRAGEIYGDAFEGAIEGLFKLKGRGFRVVIFTTRTVHEDQAALIREWFFEKAVAMELPYSGLFSTWRLTGSDEDFPFEITNEKIPAIAYVDDRAIRFVNWADTLRYFV